MGTLTSKIVGKEDVDKSGLGVLLYIVQDPLHMTQQKAQKNTEQKEDFKHPAHSLTA